MLPYEIKQTLRVMLALHLTTKRYFVERIYTIFCVAILYFNSMLRVGRLLLRKESYALRPLPHI